MLKKIAATAVVVVSVLVSCASLAGSSRNRYPAHWWQEYPRKGAPAWEVLPHEAAEGEVILSKRNELGILSNFAPTPFEYRGKRYASLEGFWQMMLYPDPQLASDPRVANGLQWKFTREQVAQMTGFEAKDAGSLAKENMKKLGIDWVSFEGKTFKYKSHEPAEHHQLIWEATLAKVDQNPEVKRILLQTGDLVLKPDHVQDPASPPEWRYYDLYMKIRARLDRSGRAAGPGH